MNPLDTVRRCASLLALFAFAWLACPAGADEEEPAGGLVETTEEGVKVRLATDEEAAEVVEALKAAARRRDASDVLPSLEKAEGLCHPDFGAHLVKLVTHGSTEVCLAAADVLGQQVLLEEKERGKLAKELWKRGWSHPDNADRTSVRSRVLRAIGLLSPAPLGGRESKEVERVWRGVTGNPAEALAPILSDILHYARTTGDKSLFRPIAEEIDEPLAKDVNSGTNPPAAWWEARWHLWNQVKAEVATTLKAMTGREFKTTEEAKAWAETQPRNAGYDW
jgi:hypothetical protein